jgi:hypothetical protein
VFLPTEPAAGALARVLPQRLFSQVPTLFYEIEDIDFLASILLNP